MERKRLAADGSALTRQTRGVLIPRPVCVEDVTPIGKEVIVDPTDTDEGLTAEMLGATDVLEYENLGERIETLRVAIKAAGIKPVARASEVSRSEVQAIANEGALPRRLTIEMLEQTLGRLRRAQNSPVR